MRIFSFISAVLLLGAASMVSSAQDTSSQEAKKAQLQKEIALIDKQLKDNASKSRSALSNLSLVQKKVGLRRQVVTQTEYQIRVYNDSLYSKQRQINDLQKRVDTLSTYYSRLVLGAYKNRDARIWYMYIFASDNVSQAFRRYSYFRNLSNSMKEQAVKLRSLQRKLEEEREELARLKAEAEKVKTQKQKEVSDLEKEQGQCEGIIKDLKKNKAKYEKELAAKKKQVEALNKEIKRIIAEAVKKQTAVKKSEADITLAGEFAANKGKLPWPVSGTVVNKYGQHNHSVFTNVKLPFNYGIDIAVAKGSKATCVFDGVVRQIAVIAGNNQCVLVQHGDYFTLYCKLKSTSVKTGDKIKTGQTIGVVDVIGGESMLHFELWQGQNAQNPELWLR
ncbi:MAG: peptidoglycan DD-metalloendopeptidase family protein [Bacteroidales bacterium]|nr:peptidoglycan DD-metalloendopeptidase family protein [Bacteroidales bacterium]